jgi:beta-galactosidase
LNDGQIPNTFAGGLKEYWDAFRASDGLWGGFIWDWVDQGLSTTTPAGERYWGYGGDFGDQPNDGQVRAYLCEPS